jgi:GR25 family glycosyltransferase involved in LPS biosynthesis
MKIGITVSFKHSVFSSGASQTSLALAELFSYLGDSCTLIHVSEETWWEDISSLRSTWPCIAHTDVVAGQFDRILEVILCPSLRALAPCIWIIRKMPLFLDMEACVVPYPLPKRDIVGIAETWVQEEMASADDLQYLELITRKPVRPVPFIWSAVAIEAYRKEKLLPIWQQTYNKDEPFTVHICETNTSSSSSCIVPLCIFREACPSTHLKVHNIDVLKDSEYFKKNLWDNLTGDLTVDAAFVGRQRIVELPSAKNVLLIAHSRFIHLRPYHLDALWCGIPLVHNSTLLRSLGEDVEKGYYANNDIVAGAAAVKRMLGPWITPNGLFQVRKNILHRFGLLNKSLCARWKEACHSTLALPEDKPRVIRLAFSDMWENFNPSYNFFTLLLESTFPKYTFIVESDSPDLLIFGPFGDAWKKFTCPKIHFTGENTGPVTGVALNLGFQRREDQYIRLPLWMLEIDWFGADAEKIRNPVPVPISFKPVVGRPKFCAFIVSNPCQKVRNRAFHALSLYKEVDSAGRLYNTLGDELFAGGGGGGGEKKKVDFLRQYRFCLAYENAASPGYVTEKLFHAKAAGCVPIYWGAPDVEQDFCMDGVIDARGKTEDEMVAMVRRVEEDPALWLKMANTPLFNEGEKKLFVLLEKVAHAIVSCANPSTQVQPANQEILSIPAEKSHLGNTVFITGCNSKFIPTLLRYWLPPISAQKAISTNIQVHVYLLHDVSEKERADILAAFPFVHLFDLPQEVVFSDCWNPQHFLWKLWILRHACTTVEPGYPVFYLDTGGFLCRWPKAWLTRVKEEGICLLEDVNHDNNHMCSKSFVKEMSLTAKELSDSQILAGAIAFLAGHGKAMRLFEEAWTLGQNPAILVGEKWTGVDAENKPIGHRHDQSILSVLSRRHGIARHPHSDVYSHISMRHTFLKGLSLYVHRGFFVVNDPIVDGVDTMWVINLDRRADRMARGKFPEKAIRFSAVDGRKLQLTPDLVRMFSNSKGIDWRRGVIACALSHISLWMKLVDDKPAIQSYMVLEDDAVLDPQWMPLLTHITENGLIPDDCDVLYLGGVLPPNKEGYSEVVEEVNECVGRIKENTLFSFEPSRNFHFCAYSYIIRRSGARKLLAMLQERGCWAPADHLICNSFRELNIYVTLPLVAGCYQDSDPKYAESKFNIFGKEEYDSDLRNDEVFTKEEVSAATSPGVFDLRKALTASSASASSAPASAPSPASSSAAASSSAPSSSSVTVPESSKLYPIIFHDIDALFERQWLEDLLGKPLVDIRTSVPIVIYQRPHCESLKKTLSTWPAFTLLHLSDELCQDPIDIYEWPSCKGVIRNYQRKGLSSKVVTIPLGYHWRGSATERPRKDLIWSFIGSETGGRRDKLQNFKGIQPMKCVLQKEWNSPGQCGREEVVDSLQRSLCVPCPAGINYETFRIYETLEAGAIPMLVEENGSTELLEYLKRWIPISTSPDWVTAAKVLHGLSQNTELYKEYRKSILIGWVSLKQWAAKEAKRILLAN